MSRTRNYLWGIGSGYTVSIATILVGLGLTPFTLRLLGREEYALFALASDVLMWLGLLDLGIASGLRVQMAQLVNRVDGERINRLTSTAFFAQLVASLLVIFVGGVLAVGFPQFLSVRPGLQAEVTTMLGLMIIGSSLSMVTQTFSALLIAHQQVHIDNVIRLFLIVVRTGITVVLLYAGWGLLSLAIANLVAVVVTSFVSVVRVKRLLVNIRISYRLVSWDILRNLGGLGIWFTIGGLAGIAIIGLDRVITAKLFSLETVTTLSLTSRLYALSATFINQLADTARPMMGQLLGQNKIADAYRVYRQIFTYSTGAAIIVAGSLLAGNAAFVSAWVGSINYGGDALNLACAFNVVINAWVLANRSVLSAGFVVRPQALSRLVEGVINISLSLVLGIKFGIVGIVMSTAIAGVITSCWYLPLLTARMLRQSFIQLFWHDSTRMLGMIVVIFPLSFWMGRVDLTLEGFAEPIFKGVIVAGIGLGLLWIVGLDSTSRSSVVYQITKMHNSITQGFL
jgi:O-antigen/teichoic acid export membrane protein